MNLQAEKKYIQDVEKRVRELELEKVKLEQQREYAEKSINDNLKKMEELGFTPETIDEGIEKLYNNIESLKSKINTILNIEPVKEKKDESIPF